MVLRKLLMIFITVLSFFVAAPLIGMEELTSNLTELKNTLDNLHSILTQNIEKSPSTITNLNKLKIYLIKAEPKGFDSVSLNAKSHNRKFLGELSRALAVPAEFIPLYESLTEEELKPDERLLHFLFINDPPTEYDRQTIGNLTKDESLKGKPIIVFHYINDKENTSKIDFGTESNGPKFIYFQVDNNGIVRLPDYHEQISKLSETLRIPMPPSSSSSSISAPLILGTKKVSALEKPNFFYAITTLSGQEFIDANLVRDLSNRLGLTLTQKKITDSEWLEQKCPILFYYVPQNATNELGDFLDGISLSESTFPIVILLRFEHYDYSKSKFIEPHYYPNIRLFTLLTKADGQLADGQDNKIYNNKEIYNILSYLNKKCGKNLTALLNRYQQEYLSKKAIEPRVTQSVPPQQQVQVREQPSYPQPIQYPPQPFTYQTTNLPTRVASNTILYTSFSSWDIWDNAKQNPIKQLQQKLGIPFERASKLESEQIKNNPRALYFLYERGRISTDIDNINGYINTIKEQNGRFLIIFFEGLINFQDFNYKSIFKSGGESGVSIYLITFSNIAGIEDTSHNISEIDELKKALWLS